MDVIGRIFFFIDALMDDGSNISFSCQFYDTDLVHKIAQILLPGLASSCIDYTTGDMFKSPASVAVDIRKEMVDYLISRSESFVVEFVVEQRGDGTEMSDDPVDVAADFVDDFVASKRNVLSRVSGWLLSEKREDKIDDFLQELELNDFWPLARRRAVAETLLKHVDFRSLYHCDKRFDTTDDCEEHRNSCSLRIMNCANEGCGSTFSAKHFQKHDSGCLYKVLPCEQNCSERILRREMDRHCITVCPMKLVNCPFYQLGCKLSFPKCVVDKHCTEYLEDHVMCVLHSMHKGETREELRQRIKQLEQVTYVFHYP